MHRCCRRACSALYHERPPWQRVRDARELTESPGALLARRLHRKAPAAGHTSGHLASLRGEVRRYVPLARPPQAPVSRCCERRRTRRAGAGYVNIQTHAQSHTNMLHGGSRLLAAGAACPLSPTIAGSRGRLLGRRRRCGAHGPGRGSRWAPARPWPCFSVRAYRAWRSRRPVAPAAGRRLRRQLGRHVHGQAACHAPEHGR